MKGEGDMSMEVAWGVIKIGKSIYSAKELVDKIENIHNRINEIYFDFAKSFEKTATNNIVAATTSSNPEREITMAIVSLQNSYNILQTLKTKTIKKHFLIFSYDTPAIKDYNQIFEPSWNLALLIFELYLMLREQVLANNWLEAAQDNFMRQYTKNPIFFEDNQIWDYDIEILKEAGLEDQLYTKEESHYSRVTGMTTERHTYVTSEGRSLILSCYERYNKGVEDRFHNMVKRLRSKYL